MEFAYIIGYNVSASGAPSDLPTLRHPRSVRRQLLERCYSRGEHAGRVILLQTRAVEQTYLSIDLADGDILSDVPTDEYLPCGWIFTIFSPFPLPVKSRPRFSNHQFPSCQLLLLLQNLCQRFSYWKIHPSFWHYSKSYFTVLLLYVATFSSVRCDQQIIRKDRSGPAVRSR